MFDIEIERKEQMILKPLFSKHLKTTKMFGFDIETHGSNNEFYMGGLFSEEHGYKAFYNKEEMQDELMKNKIYQGNTYIVATNLGFDFNGTFFNSKYWNDTKLIHSGSQMILASYKNKKSKQKIKFIDTLNFAKLSVANMGKILGLPKLEQPACLGRLPKNEYEKRELEIYNRRDCEVSYYFMKFLQEAFAKLGGNTKLTIASTSMDIFRRKYLRRPIQKEKETIKGENINNIIFESYYGGRTEAFKRGHIKNMKLYDINSLYPSVMRKQYPNPNSVRIEKKNCSIDKIKEFEGVSTLTITTPTDLRYPLLPRRCDKTKKLTFPLGTFKGTFTHIEIRKALEIGYKINKIHKTVWYKKTFYPFRDFVKDMYNLRLKYKEQGNPLELSVKLIMNSLYGKFASKHMNDTQFFNKSLMSDEELVQFENLPKIDDKLKDGRKEIVMHDDDTGMITEKSICKSSFVFPILASYTTAYARLLLYDYLTKYEALYCDTDSIVTDKTIPESNKLGAMKLEYDILEGVIVKPKMYYFKVPVSKSFPTGEVIKLKGVPKVLLDNKTKSKKKLSINDFIFIMEGGIVTYDKFAKLKESVRRGFLPNSVQEVRKSLSLEDTKREWLGVFNRFNLQDSNPLIIDDSIT